MGEYSSPLLLMLIVFCAAVGLVVVGEEAVGRSRMVSLVTLDEYPPLCFARRGQANQGREVIAPGADSSYLQGYAWDVVREAFHSQNFIVVLDSVSWSRAETAARFGKVADDVAVQDSRRRSSFEVNFDVMHVNLFSTRGSDGRERQRLNADLLFPAIRTSAREAVFEFSERPVDQMSMTFYTNASGGQVPADMTVFNGRKIGVMKGWNYPGVLEGLQDINRVDLEDIESGFRLLRQGRIDALLGYDVVFDRELTRIGWADKFYRLRVPGELREYICGIKEAPRTRLLLETYSRGVAHLESTGRLAELARKWNIPQPAANGAVEM